MKATNLAIIIITISCSILPLLAEQTGNPRRVLAADYSTKRIGIIDKDGKLEWEHPIQDIHDAWRLPNGNILFQTSWTQILELTPERKIVWRYDAARQNGNEGKRVEVHAFQRLENGLTMIAESGPGRIIEVDRDGVLRIEVKLKLNNPDAHRDTRLVRKLKSGTYLVAHEGDGCVREYDSTGKIIWEHDAKAQVYSAERLGNGDTLIGCGSGNRVIEVDRFGKIVWSVEKNELPGITLAWVTMVERLPNGNTTLVNCHAGPENPQIIEVTPDKKVVWTFKDFKNFGNALPVARILE
ncbi:MAG: PQQ-binding-like beta-propeller repeat protein [Verrucomicrobiota bacterium]